jgi:hypothetical protein
MIQHHNAKILARSGNKLNRKARDKTTWKKRYSVRLTMAG